MVGLPMVLLALCLKGAAARISTIHSQALMPTSHAPALRSCYRSLLAHSRGALHKRGVLAHGPARGLAGPTV